MTQLPAALGPYRLSVDAGEFVFLSGQIGLNPAGGELAGESIEIQTKQALENVKSVLESQGLKLKNVVKTTIFLADMGDFSTVNKIYGEYFTADFPARSTVAVKQLPKNAKVEIETIARRS